MSPTPPPNAPPPDNEPPVLAYCAGVPRVHNQYQALKLLVRCNRLPRDVCCVCIESSQRCTHGELPICGRCVKELQSFRRTARRLLTLSGLIVFCYPAAFLWVSYSHAFPAIVSNHPTICFLGAVAIFACASVVWMFLARGMVNRATLFKTPWFWSFGAKGWILHPRNPRYSAFLLEQSLAKLPGHFY
jgi:hypothetical protein